MGGSSRLFVHKTNDIGPDRIQSYPLPGEHVRENGRRHRSFIAQDTEQGVSGTYVAVLQMIGFPGRVVQHVPALIPERRSGRQGYRRLPSSNSDFDIITDPFDRSLDPEKPRRKALVLADKSQKQVLGLDRYVSELVGLSGHFKPGQR